MIYGLNFNGTEIPSEARRHFPARLRVWTHPHTGEVEIKPARKNGRADFLLAGVTDSTRDLSLMYHQANNGNRRFHYITSRDGKWTAFYVGAK